MENKDSLLFLTSRALTQTVLQDIKNPLSMFIGMLKAIEFHVTQHEIPQPLIIV